MGRLDEKRSVDAVINPSRFNSHVKKWLWTLTDAQRDARQAAQKACVAEYRKQHRPPRKRPPLTQKQRDAINACLLRRREREHDKQPPRNCEVCEKEFKNLFLRRPGIKNRYKFCSDECAAIGKQRYRAAIRAGQSDEYSEKVRARARELYAMRPPHKIEHKAEVAKKHRHRNPVAQLLRSCRARSRKNGTENNLTIEDLPVPPVCPISNKPFGKSGRGCKHDGISIDRRDNSKPYTKGNCFIISLRANTWKSSMTIDDVRRLLAYMEAGNDKAQATI